MRPRTLNTKGFPVPPRCCPKPPRCCPCPHVPMEATPCAPSLSLWKPQFARSAPSSRSRIHNPTTNHTEPHRPLRMRWWWHCSRRYLGAEPCINCADTLRPTRSKGSSIMLTRGCFAAPSWDGSGPRCLRNARSKRPRHWCATDDTRPASSGSTSPTKPGRVPNWQCWSPLGWSPNYSGVAAVTELVLLPGAAGAGSVPARS